LAHLRVNARGGMARGRLAGAFSGATGFDFRHGPRMMLPKYSRRYRVIAIEHCAEAERRSSVIRVAALFVETGGVYFGLPDVDPWDERRDARTYPGPRPVVAHPPCQRWGRYWSGGPSASERRKLGDDGGCFAAALLAVRRWGGVLEHPEASHAWRVFGLARPPRTGGWIRADNLRGWTCCVEQGHYGHRARKATWLYAAGCSKADLIWGPSASETRLDAGYHSTAKRKRAVRTGICRRMGKRERAATPLSFRDLLLNLARSARSGGAA